MELEDAIKAGGKPLLDGWLDMALMSALPESPDDSHEQQAFKLAAAREAVAAIAGEDAPIEERMQAVLYVVAHAAAMDYQAQAVSRFLPDSARLIAQRLAARLMTMTARQLSIIERLRAARGRAEGASKREDRREAERDRKARHARDVEVLHSMERQLKTLEEMDKGDRPMRRVLREDAAAAPEAALNRQMRRALAREERRAGPEATGPGPGPVAP